MCPGGGVTPNRYHPARRTCIGSLPSGRTSAARAVWNRMRSGAQPPIGSTGPLGSVSEPRPPVGCSPRVRPFPPRPPPEVAFLCSVLPRYYDLIRLLTRVHARRVAIAFPSRPGTSPGTGETSQVPRKELPHVHKVSDCARFFPCKPIRHGTMLLS